MLGGVVAAQGEIDLVTVLLVAWVAAALGDIASFVLGARLGRRFLLRHGPRVGVTGPRLDRVEAFYERHGAKAILVGRFVGIVRAVSPFLAGSSGLPFRRFLPWSILGTAIWASAFTLVGYALQRVLQRGRGHADARRLRARGDRRDRARRARAHRRTAELLATLDQVDDEDERLVRADHAARAARAVGHVRRDRDAGAGRRPSCPPRPRPSRG